MSDVFHIPIWVLVLQILAILGCIVPLCVRRMPNWLRAESLQLACVSKLGLLTLLTGLMNLGCSITCGMLGAIAMLGLLVSWPPTFNDPTG